MRYSFFQKILGSIFNCGLIITVGISLFCSKTDPSVNDPNWREESLKLASGICNKMVECIQESKTWKNGNAIHRKFIESRLQEANCKEYHRKTNVYLLKGNSPEIIQKVTRDCHKEIISMTCNQIIQNELATNKSCMLMEQIQGGIVIK
jgi:hypothetical protein